MRKKMAIIAKVTVYDDETGEVFKENEIIEPDSKEFHFDNVGNPLTREYEFKFRLIRSMGGIK